MMHLIFGDQAKFDMMKTILTSDHKTSGGIMRLTLIGLIFYVIGLVILKVKF
jgi:hypothetical protein